jgi:CRP-like cAMP-binding protein/tetratricopeptide (TPR) repeat protein
MAEESSRERKLRKQLDEALARQKDQDAIDVLGELIEADPKQPRWPHKRGDLYRKKNRRKEAVDCYKQATNLYADQGFLARAIAMAKTVVDLDPQQIDILERLDPEAARKIGRQPKAAAAPAPAPATTAKAEPAAARKSDPEPKAPAAAKHSALLPEDEPPMRHRAIIPEGSGANKYPPLPPHLSAPSTTKRGESRFREALKRQASGNTPEPGPAPRAPRRQRDLSQSLLDMAEELTIAPDVKPNETRFSNAPPPRTTIDLTDDELQPRKAAKPKESLRPPPPSAKKLSKLPLFPLFAELPQEALIELVKGSDVIELADGATVVKKGEPADSLYGVVEGSVDIVVPGQQWKTTLAEGDVFGESSLLVGEKRRADVIVRGYLVALRIPRQVFNQVFVAYPRLAELLLELLTRRLLGNLLQSSPLFQEFDAHGRQQLVQVFEIRRAARGTALAAIGKVMDGLYINLTGLLEVNYADGRAPEQHEAGTMFGQSSLLSHEASDVGVTALSNMLVLRLPNTAFHTIAMQYPGMLAHVSELASTSVARVGG